MEEIKIQNQIAIYMTSKKLCEFNDKLKVAPMEYYGHIHAQSEKVSGNRSRSCVGIVLQDYSNGTGSNTVRVTANLSPEFFAYALGKIDAGVETFDFSEEKIFGEPDDKGLCMVTKVSIKRASVGKDGKPRNYPWCVTVENGRAVKESTATGGCHAKKNSYVRGNTVFVNINDYDMFTLMQRVCRYISIWELTWGPRLLREANKAIAEQQSYR